MSAQNVKDCVTSLVRQISINMYEVLCHGNPLGCNAMLWCGVGAAGAGAGDKASH